MRLYQISVVLLVAVLLGMAVPAMAGVPQQAPGSVPNMCDPTTGGPCIIADFIASPITGDAPLRVQFLDTSSGRPSMWSWDFGDGSNRSSIADPVHTYTKPGKYTVTLVASSTTGGTSTKVKEAYIIVTDPTPIYADFVASPTWGKAPLEVEFSDCTIGNPTSWLWDFGDGSTGTVQNPVHIYTKPGKYTVTLTASTELGKSSTKVKEKYITVEGECQIIADFVFEPQTGIAPLTVRFQDRSSGSPTMWSWDFGDGPIPMEEEVSCSGDGCSNIANPVHTYTQPGTYTIRLTASSETCLPGTIEKTITVSSPRMDVDFVGTPTSGRAPLTVAFTDLTIGDPTMWAWEFGDGATDMVADPTHTYSEPGVYTVRLAASNQYGGSGEMVKERYITVDPACDIKADFSASPTTGSAPLTVQFTDLSTGHPTMWHWDFGDGVIPMESCSGDGCDNIANPTHTYLEPGEYTVTLTASDQYGCSDTVTKKEFVVVVPACDIKADFRADPETGTAPLTVRFTDLSTGYPTMWSWDFGDGPIPMEENASCSGDGCSNVANPIHTYLEPGEYTVTLTASDQYGCSDTVTKQQYVVVVPACDIKADFIADPTTGSAPLKVQFTDTSTGNPTMWKWDFGDGAMPMDVACSGGGCDNIANPYHTYLDPGTYTVTLTASNQDGCSDTETKKNYITVGAGSDGDIPLSAGWNFVSVPRKLEPGKDTGAILSHIDVKGHSVFQYDESKHVWNIMNSASPIRPLEAFWIYSSKADKIPVTFDKNPVQTPPTRTLKKGWNGIGFTGLTPIEAKYTLLSVQNQWVNCIGYNAGAQRYHDMIIKGNNDQTLMEPYMGYWLYMNAEGILAANAA